MKSLSALTYLIVSIRPREGAYFTTPSSPVDCCRHDRQYIVACTKIPERKRGSHFPKVIAHTDRRKNEVVCSMGGVIGGNTECARQNRKECVRVEANIMRRRFFRLRTANLTNNSVQSIITITYRHPSFRGILDRVD